MDREYLEILKRYYPEMDLDELETSSSPKSCKKCECGATAVGSDKHSDYCPLYKEDTYDNDNI